MGKSDQVEETSVREDLEDSKPVEEEWDFKIESFEEIKDPITSWSGFARLTNVEYAQLTKKQSQALSEYFKDQDQLENVYVFTAHLLPVSVNRESKIQVVIPDSPDSKQLNQLFKWAETSEVSQLAGKEIPITKISNRVYTISVFEGITDNMNVPSDKRELQSLIDRDKLVFNGEEWEYVNPFSTTAPNDFQDYEFFVLAFTLFIFMSLFPVLFLPILIINPPLGIILSIISISTLGYIGKNLYKIDETE